MYMYNENKKVHELERKLGGYIRWIRGKKENEGNDIYLNFNLIV